MRLGYEVLRVGQGEGAAFTPGSDFLRQSLDRAVETARMVVWEHKPRTGELRTTHNSNSIFGQPHTPSWVLNLEASPAVEVEYRGRRGKAVARPATPEEEASVWQAAAGVYRGYAKYQQRISGRSIRVFVLEATTA